MVFSISADSDACTLYSGKEYDKLFFLRQNHFQSCYRVLVVVLPPGIQENSKF